MQHLPWRAFVKFQKKTAIVDIRLSSKYAFVKDHFITTNEKTKQVISPLA